MLDKASMIRDFINDAIDKADIELTSRVNPVSSEVAAYARNRLDLIACLKSLNQRSPKPWKQSVDPTISPPTEVPTMAKPPKSPSSTPMTPKSTPGKPPMTKATKTKMGGKSGGKGMGGKRGAC